MCTCLPTYRYRAQYLYTFEYTVSAGFSLKLQSYGRTVWNIIVFIISKRYPVYILIPDYTVP